MNIYVSSLSYGVTSDDLRVAFEKFGEVSSANVIMDKFTQKSKGFGFVEMSNQQEANTAIESLSGSTFDGRTINVAEARERVPRERSSSPFKGDKGFSNRW